jgi:3-oxoacyl-[acyl-carrier protein] reductase
MFNFNDRVLLMTGANGGIGREIAKLFFQFGARLLLADQDESGLREFASSMGGDDARIVTIGMDAANSGDAAKAVRLAVDLFGGIDFLVPSAGHYEVQPFASMTDEQWHKTLGINLDGVFYICHHAFRALRENSAIVNLTSVAAHRGSYYNAHYGSSKGGVLALTRCLARELAPRTRVNAVSPGIIETRMTADLIRLRGAESIDQTLLKRLGRASEVATAIAFLCSDGASFITGEVLHVNGGLYVAG